MTPDPKICRLKELATASEKRTYFTGKSCKNGHVCERITKTSACVLCRETTKKSSAKKNRIEANKRAVARRRADPEKYKAHWQRWNNLDPVKRMAYNAKAGAKKRGLEYRLTEADIKAVWPKDGRCPVFGTVLHWGDCRNSSPSLDRIDNRVGYVPGNIAVISDRANILKRDVVDPEELRKLALWLEKAKRAGT